MEYGVWSLEVESGAVRKWEGRKGDGEVPSVDVAVVVFSVVDSSYSLDGDGGAPRKSICCVLAN